jgi:hypothetical protein
VDGVVRQENTKANCCASGVHNHLPPSATFEQRIPVRLPVKPKHKSHAKTVNRNHLPVGAALTGSIKSPYNQTGLFYPFAVISAEGKGT